MIWTNKTSTKGNYFFFLQHCLVLPFLLFTACLPVQKKQVPNFYLVQKQNKPLVIAHGGAKLLRPENTLTAFDHSLALGVDALEMDLRLTKDSQLVCHHDETINRTSNGTGTVLNYSLKELKKLNFGFKFKNLEQETIYRDSLIEIPSLAEVFERYGKQLPLIVELKDSGEVGKAAARKLLDLLDKFQMPLHTVVASFHSDVLDYFGEISQNRYMISGSPSQLKKWVLLHKLRLGFLHQPPMAVLQIPLQYGSIKLNSNRLINAAHKQKMAIQYWTVNEKEEMLQLINRGADGIITDRPDLLLEILGNQ